MKRSIISASIGIFSASLSFLGLSACEAPERTMIFDIVIEHGRVIDPETKFDAVRSVGILDGKIVSITEEMLTGRETINAVGLVVAPGFIDIHSHSPTPLGTSYQIRDGVTALSR